MKSVTLFQHHFWDGSKSHEFESLIITGDSTQTIFKSNKRTGECGACGSTQQAAE